MRIKLDENLPAVLVDDLAGLGHDVDTALSEGLGGHEDAEVWAGAQAAGRMQQRRTWTFRTFACSRPERIQAWFSCGSRNPDFWRSRDV